MSDNENLKKDQEFIDILINGTEDELQQLKAFLFKENIRLELERKDLEELKMRVFQDRERLRVESDEVNNHIVVERKRLKEEQMFFEKKMDILRNGFEALEADRRALTNAKREFEKEKMNYSGSVKKLQNEDLVVCLFQGVNNILSLKKRYKDLLKIFHPDNMAGDHEMVLAINSVYEELKKNYDSSKII